MVAVYNPEAISNSVIVYPDLTKTPTTENLFWFVSNSVESTLPWGAQYKERDKQLRNYITQENLFASALGIVASRNASFSWKLNGPPRTLNRMQTILESANAGKGWENLILKTSIDLYTQDAGAFWEIIREKNEENAPIIGINHLDAARCYHTGVPEAPVIYLDRKGKFHLLYHWNVITFAEMPAPIENFDGLQYCALTRLLLSFQTRKSVAIRDYERTNGRHAKSVHLVHGITTRQLQDAINTANATADASGLMRYMDPILVGSIDPKAAVGHDTIELTAAPEDYKSDEFFKQYIASMAMAFLSDYQEFSPLPGGNLGTSTQSEILHLKNRGKGIGLFRKLITHNINWRIMPQNCTFGFSDPDFEAEQAEAEVKKTRAQTRQIRLTALEITPEVARQIANDDGDLPQQYMAMMGDTDQTENLMVVDNSPAKNQIDEQIQVSKVPVVRPQPINDAQTSRSQGFGERARRIIEVGR